MSAIVTIDGNELDMLTPNPAHMTAFDIAWSLSMENRFAGRTLRPYSVAEHLLLCADIAARTLGLDLHGQMAVFMHDAHEAYSKDMYGPAKPVIGEAWRRWESAWEARVRVVFGLHTAADAHAESIHRADLIALATEKHQLMPQAKNSHWPILDGIEPVHWVDLYSPERRAMTWEDWRDRWLDKFYELDFGRRQLAGVPA